MRRLLLHQTTKLHLCNIRSTLTLTAVSWPSRRRHPLTSAALLLSSILRPKQSGATIFNNTLVDPSFPRSSRPASDSHCLREDAELQP